MKRLLLIAGILILWWGVACDIIDTGKSTEEKVTVIPVDIFESGKYKTFYIHPGYIAVMFYPDTDVSRKKEIFAEYSLELVRSLTPFLSTPTDIENHFFFLCRIPEPSYENYISDYPRPDGSVKLGNLPEVYFAYPQYRVYEGGTGTLHLINRFTIRSESPLDGVIELADSLRLSVEYKQVTETRHRYSFTINPESKIDPVNGVNLFAESFNIVGGYVHWFVRMKVGI